MIVLDASCLVELLLRTDKGAAIADRIAEPDQTLHMPHLADLEILQTLRRHLASGAIREEQALEAIQDLRALEIHRHLHEPYLDEVWRLRRNVSAYDAMYLVLAYSLDATLLTLDARLARAPGVRARVEVL